MFVQSCRGWLRSYWIWHRFYNSWVILFFDRGLLALGNIFWLAGVGLLLGWRATVQLFTNRSNYKGSASFVLGLFFIFVRWPIVGIIFEIYGCIVLFGLVLF
ncbi:unnamed protein product [Thlaspi arvense]|uniref:Uncharacterized protein n=1 Tax=Thlaspi arvense TaxID=13288 RepID=A0AAU9RFQ7_THLAR|nr:unnamed protein product [Thlaspi arvense]